MPAIYVDTMEDFYRVRPLLEPVYVTSKTRGRVLVPCATTILVKVALVVENLFNPNNVPADKMALLQESVLDNGFCFPVVTIWDEEQACFVVVDGAHRRRISGPDWLDFDYLPVVVLAHDMAKRIAATVQFNKARGVHQVDLDAELVRKLVEQGLSDEDISTKLGMSVDAVHRYKQVTGVAELFRNTPYSIAFEMRDGEKSSRSP